MVPRADLIVTITGVLQILGAIGLTMERTARAAAIGLTLLLAAMFPANVHASLHALKIADAPVTPLLPRTLIQLAFIAGLLVVAGPPWTGNANRRIDAVLRGRSRSCA